MTRFTELLVLTISLGMALALPGSALAADPITQVVTIDTNGKTDALLAHKASNEKIFKRLGIDAKRRYMQASLAGPNTGSVAVVIEYPSLSAMAAAQEKLQADAEWRKYIDEITKAGLTVQSNSIWVEMQP